MEKPSSKNSVRGDSSGDGSLSSRTRRSLSESEFTTTPLKFPMWMQIIARLPIEPRIPDFLERRFPALMGLVCYGYLPNMIVLGYMMASVCIMVYYTFPIAHILLALIYGVPCLVSLKVATSWFLRLYEAQTRGARWELDKTFEEYVKLIQKERR